MWTPTPAVSPTAATTTPVSVPLPRESAQQVISLAKRSAVAIAVKTSPFHDHCTTTGGRKNSAFLLGQSFSSYFYANPYVYVYFSLIRGRGHFFLNITKNTYFKRNDYSYCMHILFSA